MNDPELNSADLLVAIALLVIGFIGGIALLANAVSSALAS